MGLVLAHNSDAGEAETGESLGLVIQSFWLKFGAPGLSESPGREQELYGGSQESHD